MICEHCEYSAHSAPFGNEFLYCKFYNDRCISLIPNECMFYVPFESIGEVTLVGGLVKSNYISCAPRQITPRKVIFSGPKTIVIWEDGTKTIVGCAEGQEYDEYAGFCAALAKKIFGTTSAAKRVMDANKVINSPKEITQKEDIDYRTITYEISENLKKALRECLNGIALMDFQKKVDDISSKAFDSEKEDDKNE